MVATLMTRFDPSKEPNVETSGEIEIMRTTDSRAQSSTRLVPEMQVRASSSSAVMPPSDVFNPLWEYMSPYVNHFVRAGI